MLAERQLSQGKFATAHVFSQDYYIQINFLLCRDIDKIALTIHELLKNSYQQTEIDLFVARAMLEFYSRTDNFELPKKLRK